jgi:hypothetical protein
MGVTLKTRERERKRKGKERERKKKENMADCSCFVVFFCLSSNPLCLRIYSEEKGEENEIKGNSGGRKWKKESGRKILIYFKQTKHQ